MNECKSYVEGKKNTCINCAHIMCLFHGENRSPVFVNCWQETVDNEPKIVYTSSYNQSEEE